MVGLGQVVTTASSDSVLVDTGIYMSSVPVHYLVLSPLTRAPGGTLQGVRGLLRPQLLHSDLSRDVKTTVYEVDCSSWLVVLDASNNFSHTLSLAPVLWSSHRDVYQLDPSIWDNDNWHSLPT